MKIRLKLVLTAFIGLLCHYRGFAQDIHFTLVEPPKEQTWSGILSMTQDPDGYLWFATGEGVYKYDGHHFTQYRHEAANPNSLAANRVEKVLADKKGMIWIGTLGAGLDRFDPVSNTFTHHRFQQRNRESLANDSVTAIIEDHKGIFWLGTNGGLVRFDPNTGKFKQFAHNDRDPHSLSNNQVRVVYEGRKGTIWVGTGSVFHGETPAGEGGLNKLDQNTGKFTRYMHDAKDPASLTDNRVRVIFEDSRGTFWIGTAGDGLYTMDRKKGTFEHHPYDPGHPEKLSRPALKKDLYYADDHITFITEDNSGKIWIGTFEGGINVYDPATKKTVWYGADPASKEKLLTNQFWNAFKTRDGVLWINAWNSPQLYKISPYQNKLPYHFMGEYVYAFVEDADNTLWMATSKGLVHRLNDTIDQIFCMNKDPRPGKNAIYDIEKDNENKLWVLNGKGVWLFDPKTNVFTNYHHQPGNKNSLVSDSVNYLKKGTAGKLWVGTFKGLDLMDTKTGTFKHFRLTPKGGGANPGLYNYIKAIETDKDSAIWVGTNYGVNKLDEKTGHFKMYLNNVNVVSLFNDSRNVLWACTSGGLYKCDKNKDNFTYFDIPGEVGYWITEDQQHNFWVNTPGGILKINLKNNATNFYGKNQGVSGTNLATGYTRHNGEVLYGDSSGYFAFYPDKLLHRAPVVNVVIDKFLLADIQVLPIKGGLLDKPLSATKEIHLNYNQTTFSFGFNDIDFVGDDQGSPVFYMLENYEGKWRKGSPDQTANYYNVPPGAYTFKVKSINGNGLVAEKEIKVIISPPWWQRWWAYALFILLATGSLWAFIYYRSLKLLKEKRVLEHKVHIRTEEVMQQKEEIETQRDNLETQRNSLEKTLSELKATQTQLIQSEKMASLGELTAGIAHEIQNPLNFVNNFSEVSAELTSELKEELKNGNVEEAIELANNLEENLGKIQHHGKRADFIVKGMLQHSRTGTGERQATNINVLADEFLKLSYHGLRAKDKNFNTEMVTNFDENLPKINVVQQDIGRVLLNLFNNAFYAVNQRAKTAGKDYKPEVTVTTSTENDHVIIKVKDNGIGIPDSIKEKIMQPFFTTKPTGEGTGLGLSLTYDMVVKGHGGAMQVNSVEGEGSEFIISLPLS